MFRFALAPLIAFVAALPLCSQSTPARLSTPRLGFVRMQDGSVRAVSGGPANFVVGEPLLKNAVSASFSSSASIVAFTDRIAVFDATLTLIAEQPITDPALVGISGDADTAIAWIAKTSSAIYWTRSGFVSVELQNLPAGKVWSIRKTGHTAVLLFADQQATVSLDTGNLIDCYTIPGGTAAAIAQATGQKADDLTVEQMGDRYIHVFSRADWRTWVLRAPGSGDAWELPAAKDSQ